MTELRNEAPSELFASFTGEVRDESGRRRWFGLSMGLHTMLLLAIVFSPLLFPAEDPPPVVQRFVTFYNPPPPPPPPLPKGASDKMVEKAPEKTGAKPPDPEVLVEPKIPDEPKVEPEKGIDPLKQFGVANGSESGSIDGMAIGIEGGQVGGVPNGVLGGVIGGTGDSPVMDYDQAPRVLKMTKPVYPQEAFIKKIEGIVLVEIVIGVDGRVGTAKVKRSIPQLDSAAIQCVRQWVFSPALKGGRPVATLADAPVTFRIF